jgi:hypothetical protein
MRTDKNEEQALIEAGVLRQVGHVLIYNEPPELEPAAEPAPATPAQPAARSYDRWHSLQQIRELPPEQAKKLHLSAKNWMAVALEKAAEDVKMLVGEIVKLKERIEKMEEAGGGKTLADYYQGTWSKDRIEPYQRGHFVTDRGSMWICLYTTSERPGNSPSWRMFAKSGGK